MDIPEEALLKEGFTHEDVEGRVTDICAQGLRRARMATRDGWASIRFCPSPTPSRASSWLAAAPQIGDQAAKEGVRDLRRSGLEKVKGGPDGLEEINSVTVE